MNTDEKRVRILLRVSSEQQLEADGDLGIQREIILEYINNFPHWILNEKEYFEGGVSGYKNSVADRDVLQEALKDAENGEYDILVVYKDDRLGRRMLEIPDYVMKLKAAGVSVYTVKDGCITPDSNDPMNILSLVLRYATAEKSSSDTALRVRDTAQKLVQKGKFMGGKAPYGYVLEHSGEISKHGRALKHLVIQPEQAEIVKQIYNLSLYNEFGSAKIAHTLNTDERYKDLAPNDVWKSGTITSILTNPIYAGYTAYRRRANLNGRYRSLKSSDWIIAEKQNPDIIIIDEDTWMNVQEKRRERGNQYTKSQKNHGVTVIKRNDGLLSLIDVLHCGYCGRKMVNGSKYNYWTIKHTGERRTSKIPIYKCQNAWQGVPHNTTNHFRADMVEPIVYDALAEYISRLQQAKDIFEQIAENNNLEQQKKERALSMKKKKLEKIQHNIRVLEEHIPDAMTGDYALSLEDLVRNINTQKDRERKQQITIAQEELDLQNSSIASKNRNPIMSKIPTWREIFLHADTPAKRVLVNKLIERIDITRERIVIRFKISLEDLLPQSRMNDNEVVPEQRV